MVRAMWRKLVSEGDQKWCYGNSNPVGPCLAIMISESSTQHNPSVIERPSPLLLPVTRRG